MSNQSPSPALALPRVGVLTERLAERLRARGFEIEATTERTVVASVLFGNVPQSLVAIQQVAAVNPLVRTETFLRDGKLHIELFFETPTMSAARAIVQSWLLAEKTVAQATREIVALGYLPSEALDLMAAAKLGGLS